MPNSVSNPFQLLPTFRERVWGRKDLAPFFPNFHPDEPVGEAWFTAPDNQTSLGQTLGQLIAQHPQILGTGIDSRHPDICPLLLKLLFTTSRLSVQVHPDDEYAAANHASLGKTEAWYVLDAQPPAEVALGFRETISPEWLESSSLSGEIEHLLHWRKVAKGDVLFTPAGTVHAIGAGLTICEIQQNSDITYRLYDYGRPRELHLEHGKRVSTLTPPAPDQPRLALAAGRTQLVVSEYFRIEELRPEHQLHFGGNNPAYLLLVCVEGSGSLHGQPCLPGQIWFVPAQAAPFAIDAPGSTWLLSYQGASPEPGIEVR